MIVKVSNKKRMSREKWYTPSYNTQSIDFLSFPKDTKSVFSKEELP